MSGRVVHRVFACGIAAALLCAGLSTASAQVSAPDAPAAARPGEDPEIARMNVQALKTDDPEQKLKIYEKILDRDPSNAFALQGFKDARAAVEKKKADDRDRADKAKEDQDRRSKGRAALAAAEAAFLRRDILGARAKLNEARSLGHAGPDVIRVERLVTGAESRQGMVRMLTMGAGGVVLVGLLLWIASFFRKGRAYVELIGPSGGGRRYPIEKDVVTVGAVPEYQGEPIDIVARDPENVVSRLHCAIHRKGRDYYVVDYSSNGTRLDGRDIPKKLLIPLKRGARIDLGGECSLKFGFERRKR